MPCRFALKQHQAAGIDVPMTILPNSLPQKAANETHSPVADKSFFLFVGRLEELKGLQDVIGLFRDYPHAHLLIVGDGAYRKTLETPGQSTETVKSAGPVHPSMIAAYYSQPIAVRVQSLCCEVFPLIPAKSLVSGTPAIARRIGALTEVIEASGAEFTFTDLNEGKTALDRLRLDSNLRREVGSEGRAIAESRRSTDAHLDCHLDIVGEVLAERRQGRSDATVSPDSSAAR